MLRGIHKATSNWFGKAILSVVMGLLVVSFAIWGIGDIFRGFGRNAVAKIGNTEISIEQFRQLYTDRLQQIGRQAGRAITPDQARGLGLDRQLLSQIVAETTLDEHSRKLRLGLSDAEISRRITSDPSFRGANGQFDRARFEQLIRNAGFTEPRFVDQQRRETLRRQIAQSIIGEMKVPTTALSAINQYQNEKRSIEYLALTPAQAGDIPAATPEGLSKYFGERKILFRAPEYRKITLLSLTPADIAKPDAVSDADAKAYYEQHKNSYGTPERRELRQIVFPNAQDAASASERIAKGLSFADLAKERGLKDTDIDVGMVTKSDIIDAAVADAAFALKAGEISAPIKGSFGTVLLQVGKVEPGSQKTYEEVASQIKREQAEVRARSELNNLRDKIEDERAGGSTLAETAKKLGLKSLTIEAIDRSGRAPDGKLVADLPRTPDVISVAFGSDVGVDSEALQLPNNGLLWYDVTGITPSRERTLEEVKDQLATRWRDDEIATRLLAKADDMLGKLKAGGALSQVASEAGLKLESASGLQRGKPAGFVPAKVVDAVFKVAKGAPGSSEGETQTQRFVFRVTEVIAPPLDANSPEAKQLTTSLQNAFADDIIGEYILRIENDYGVNINQQALNQVIGGGTANR
ncbi:MAG: SurA N-terminal domain-containing protein [Rhizobiales bacterium]|nr:SurA N-terminal domain-containing protein [Hyphomicrobiales bacterium]